MINLTFSTGNPQKFAHAHEVCDSYGIKLTQNSLEIDEIQEEDAIKIVMDKANKAYEILLKPVVVSDDSWMIMGLNGFPGPYMKSVDKWFTAEDFIRLTESLEDRRVFLVGYLAYKDEKNTKVFHQKREGYLLNEIRGKEGPANQQVMSMLGDNGLSISEVYASEQSHSEREVAKIWHDFAKWYADFRK
jgi:non-canonical purine NTP pyrophosphatase (RdgB/HAM1 family)